MNITSHEEYGLRCALQLARSHGEGPLAASKISEREGISVEYVSKFMHLFRKCGVVCSVRGTQGGFSLAKPPEEVSLKEIVSALSPQQNLCSKYRGHRDTCVHLNECSVRPLWSLITYYFESVLQKLRLSDLLESELNVRQKIEAALVQAMDYPEDSKTGVQAS